MNKLFFDKKGSTLVYVMFSLVFILMMISIMMSITLSNTKQASEQAAGMQAYYVARSGVEAAYEALIGGTNPALLSQLTSGAITQRTDTVIFENGKADVVVTTSGAGLAQKIIIKSVGTTTGTGVSRTVSLEFYADYSNKEMIWSR